MASPIWNGDLSTGDLSQWGGVERKNDNGAKDEIRALVEIAGAALDAEEAMRRYAEAEYFRTSSPHIYNTFTETWKANP